MCGRYAMGIRLAFIRHQLQQHGQPVDEAADDDDVRQTYNFAPGSYGAVYRADTSDHGGVGSQDDDTANNERLDDQEAQGEPAQIPERRTHYKLQSMKWGLIPFWTKRSPDYGSMLKTINCRDDSLIEDRGMWTSMKRKKRCVVICQGFYEWLKKGPTGKEKIPHYIRRKDGDLMCFAGLWDCVQYEGSDEKLYTYTIITTSSNSYLKFLHDRMPVILEPGSPEMATWLDPHRVTWSKELQSILKPYTGELECYPVSKEVGKVGNNSPDFIIPINSKENKSNIANFFSSSSKGKPGQNIQGQDAKASIEKPGARGVLAHEKDAKVKREKEEVSKDEAVLSAPKSDIDFGSISQTSAVKRKRTSLEAKEDADEASKPPKIPKPESILLSPDKKASHSPTKPSAGNKKMRSATSNGSALKQGDAKKTTHGTQRITNFFKK
ncbi:hypothetical protein AJ78_00396 [Emergomyces pasteurianus Ep9510]|uniref:DUF159 domain protein n=1 Tax=Emergomyces pasteurianus Ep9510 TaxID=1447872 RepID=A0A1J9PTE0_9EURO|nr:hypothetical protein AJ78_00396 [Emergomyces pasteurianus Ep9510]